MFRQLSPVHKVITCISWCNIVYTYVYIYIYISVCVCVIMYVYIDCIYGCGHACKYIFGLLCVCYIH